MKNSWQDVEEKYTLIRINSLVVVEL